MIGVNYNLRSDSSPGGLEAVVDLRVTHSFEDGRLLLAELVCLVGDQKDVTQLNESRIQIV